MSATPSPRPTDIYFHQKSRQLEIFYDDGAHFNLSTEFLRVNSPSAAVRGHSPWQEVLQIGKEDVTITNVEPIGHYAVKLHFDDGHNSGIYSWGLLYSLGANQAALWEDYLRRLAEAGHMRKGAGAV